MMVEDPERVFAAIVTFLMTTDGFNDYQKDFEDDVVEDIFSTDFTNETKILSFKEFLNEKKSDNNDKEVSKGNSIEIEDAVKGITSALKKFVKIAKKYKQDGIISAVISEEISKHIPDKSKKFIIIK